MADADLAHRLHSRGLKATAPRMAVLDAVSRLDGHPDVEEIALHARARPGSLSTQAVYDNLRVLAETGLVRRIEPAGSPARFETRVGDSHHHQHGALPVNSLGQGWNGEYVFDSGDLVLDLLHNFSWRTGRGWRRSACTRRPTTRSRAGCSAICSSAAACTRSRTRRRSRSSPASTSRGCRRSRTSPTRTSRRPASSPTDPPEEPAVSSPGLHPGEIAEVVQRL